MIPEVKVTYSNVTRNILVENPAGYFVLKLSHDNRPQYRLVVDGKFTNINDIGTVRNLIDELHVAMMLFTSVKDIDIVKTWYEKRMDVTL